MKLIKFRRLNSPKEYVNAIHYLYDGSIMTDKIPIQRWEIAFNEAELYQKLNNDIVEVEMPSKAWYIQLWRRFFPLTGIELNIGEEGILTCK